MAVLSRDRRRALILVVAASLTSLRTARSCCACPETKKARDDCFLKFGSNADDSADSGAQCKDIVERHRQCMRSLGFNM